MPQYLSPIGNDQFIDANGDPLVGGRIETYLAGSSTQAATYTDDSGSTPQSNPIILDSLGKPTLGPIWLTGGVSYKFIIKNAVGSTLWTIDNIAGVNDATLSQSEWLESGFVPTYINGTSFSVPGDQTGTLQINRRLRTTNTSGFIYSTITNSVFSAGNTTVTLANDSGTLDAGLSAVAYGLLSATNDAIPGTYAKVTAVTAAAANAVATAAPTGAAQGFWRASAPSGWVKANGQTIGSAASGATGRANADTQALFDILWADFTNAVLPIQTSAGGASTRGASAAADWAANKRMTLPDMRGEFARGWDDGRGIDTGRVLGSAQAGAIEAHIHTYQRAFSAAGASAAVAGASGEGSANTGSTGGTETRPRNLAVLYCIKL